jgi:hypothetical protein
VGGLAPAFDLARITNAVAAPFLRVFCEEPVLSCRGGREFGNAGAPRGFMTMKRSRNWSALLRKLPVSSHPEEILDRGVDAWRHLMPRKS